MDLRLDRPVPAAELGRDVDRLLGTVGDTARRHGDAEAGQEFFGLIFVNVHVLLYPLPLTAQGYSAASLIDNGTHMI